MGLTPVERWALIDSIACAIQHNSEGYTENTPSDSNGRVVFTPIDIGNRTFRSAFWRANYTKAITHLLVYVRGKEWAAFGCMTPGWLRFVVHGNSKSCDSDLNMAMLTLGVNSELLETLRESYGPEIELPGDRDERLSMPKTRDDLRWPPRKY